MYFQKKLLKHGRKRIRLKDFDYSTSGYYFVTICTWRKMEWLGTVINNKTVLLNSAGMFVLEQWSQIPQHYPHAQIDTCIIMSNHIHGIIRIFNVNSYHIGAGSCDVVGAGFKPAPTRKIHALPEIVRGFKTFAAREINKNIPNKHFQWQRSFHDRIIRNDHELAAVRKYIINNPKNWHLRNIPID